MLDLYSRSYDYTCDRAEGLIGQHLIISGGSAGFRDHLRNTLDFHIASL